jgi:DnaJ family protein B protein 12
LTNPEKKRKYDEYGNEDPDQHFQHYRQYYQEDVSAEVAKNILIINQGYI